MSLVDHIRDRAGVQCGHELDEDTAFNVDQLGLSFVDVPADSATYHVGQCRLCGRWLSLARADAGLFDTIDQEDTP